MRIRSNGHALIRALLLIVVTCGLFLMHGFSSVGADCHGSSEMTASAQASPANQVGMAMVMVAKSSTSAVDYVHNPSPAHNPAGVAVACTAAQIRSGFASVVAITLLSLLVWASFRYAGACALPARRSKGEHHGPPVAGSLLFTRLCVLRL